jgi:RNA recognition motif-containing protein
MTKLFIVGIPREMGEIELVELFTRHGIVHSATIITDKETAKSQGYGFVMMDNEAGAERAITAMDGATISGRQISIRVAEDKMTAFQNVLTPANNQPSKLVYVRVKRPSEPAKKKRPRRQN